MIELKTFFERCYLINLDRRPDRWEKIQCDVIPSWPLTPIERLSAVDGQVVSPPTWWKASKGAWGCYRSHAGIIEKCLNEGVKSVLILEDDALLRDNFTAKVAEFLAAVPDDWDMIYLGGQLIGRRKRPPQKINEHVYQAFHVNRTHAMAISAKGMPKVYQWLYPEKWRKRKQIDGHLRKFHDQPTSRIYIPAQWLIGQNAGHSNTRGITRRLRFWQSAARKQVATAIK